MNSHCLNIEEYKEVLNVVYNKEKASAELEYIHEVFEGCRYWDNQVVGINYFLSLAIESFQKSRPITSDIVTFIYEFQENANFYIQEIHSAFIETLFLDYNQSHLSIEDKLIEVQNYLNAKASSY